jgi:hypothetical protein
MGKMRASEGLLAVVDVGVSEVHSHDEVCGLHLRGPHGLRYLLCAIEPVCYLLEPPPAPFPGGLLAPFAHRCSTTRCCTKCSVALLQVNTPRRHNEHTNALLNLTAQTVLMLRSFATEGRNSKACSAPSKHASQTQACQKSSFF